MSQSMVLRPARISDLPHIERIAAASAIGIGSLPPDRDKLYDKLRLSEQAFAAVSDVSGEEIYLFVLEDPSTGELVGTSGIAASAGFSDRFYSYRNEYIVHAAAELGVSTKIHSLHLCHDLTGSTLLTSFYIAPEHAGGPWPQLLSRARLLFIAEHAKRFSRRLVAESPGLCDEQGRSPFWDAVGKRFFDISYAQAERIAGGRSKRFIAELMPQYPIYVPLLPAEAQLAIGQLHPTGELPFNILLQEGFEADSYIDLFDGGPTVAARFGDLYSARCNQRLPVRALDVNDSPVRWHLVANPSLQGFRATLAPLPLSGGAATADTVAYLARDVMQALALADGDAARIVPLEPEVRHD